MSLHPLSDHTRHEIRVRFSLLIHTGRLQSGQVGLALLDSDNRPWISAGGQHSIQQEPRDAAVAIRIRMDVTEKPVSRCRPHGRFGLFLEQLKQCRHCPRDDFPARRHVARSLQKKRPGYDSLPDSRAQTPRQLRMG